MDGGRIGCAEGGAVRDSTIVTLFAMACVTTIAIIYDGQLALIAVGALVGLLAPSPLQNGKRVETPSDGLTEA